MYRHVRQNCLVKKQDDKEKNKIYEKLVKIEEENKKLQKKMLENEKHQVMTEKKLQKENQKLKKKVVSMKKRVQNVNVTKNINNGTIYNGDNYNSWLRQRRSF
jgi:hypothetical protein